MLPQSISSGVAGLLVANLNIDGLAMCCFNAEERLWEVAFLREKHHHFGIEIERVDAAGSSVTVGGCGEIPASTRLIDLVVEDGSDSHYDQYPGGYYDSGRPLDFPRWPDADWSDVDFRWTIKFSDPDIHRVTSLIKQTREGGRFGVTIMRIPCSLFYTAKVTDSPAILSRQGDGPCDGFVLGHSNDLIGGLVMAAGPSAARIVAQDGSCAIDMPYVEGCRYEIYLVNMEPSKRSPELRAAPGHSPVRSFVKGDFHLYYEVVETSGDKYFLWAKGRQRHGEGKMGDCDGVWVSDLTTLMPLIE
jgi:hypothetical protein